MCPGELSVCFPRDHTQTALRTETRDDHGFHRHAGRDCLYDAVREGRKKGLYSWDLGLGKYFSFTERVKLQFRAEFFNVFNRVNYDECQITGGTSLTGASCNTNFIKRSSTGNFGALKQAFDPRIGQLALKLQF